MKKVKVDLEKCIGCGQCYSIDEQDFEPNEDNLSKPTTGKVSNEEDAQVAMESCPTGAITIEEAEETEEAEEEKAA